ncbi:hypothetical protein [Streptomyces sp. AS58]|uniref:hypothetical protein n=1 Tax=Streptomyces sp. AS58 TaxID=1519489 RepID=UPI0006AFD4CA|nr:hypothetical protein [Streptomyces sp. AS58]
MDMSYREIHMPLNEVVAVLQDLNEFVVSFDRLGSRQAFGSADEYTVGKYIADRDVARRLSRARHVISVALDAQLSDDENAEIDTLCDQGRFYGSDSATSTPQTCPAEPTSASGRTDSTASAEVVG